MKITKKACRWKKELYYLFRDFHKKMAKNKGLLFSAQTTHHEGVVKEFHWAVAANPEEVAVGTDP